MTQQETSIKAVLEERGNRYGTFKHQSALAQALERAFLTHINTYGQGEISLVASQREALHMIFHKLARIANGDPNYADSWIDIAGYAMLIADELSGVNR